MAFWGIEVKPGSPYVHRPSEERGRLHLSQATLGSGSSTKKSIVQCIVADARPINICILLPEKIENCPLNLEFDEDDGEVTFSVLGPQSVHLSGFFFESQDVMRDGCCPSDCDSDGEDIVETDNEESSDFDSEGEDDYEEDFIDDEFDFPPSPVPNSGVVIEEILDDEKLTTENGKQPKKKNQSRVSDGNNDSQRQIVVKGDKSVPVIESEDEDGFPLSSSGKSKADGLKSNRKADKNKDERSNEKAKNKKAKDDSGRARSLKRKSDDVIEDGEQARETDQPDDTSPEGIPENDIKEKKRKNKKTKKSASKDEKAIEVGTGDQSNIQHEGATTKDIDQVLPAGKEHDLKETTNQSLDVDAVSTADANRLKEKKKKKQKKNKKLEKASAEKPATDENKSTEEVEDKASQTRTFPNGLVIEEVAMGKPDGKRASPGKQVTVHYIGKLKKNGKIFDSNIGKAPFKFRLGVGQVIKGWDVGVNGMRVGDKRRLTIPPAMGYGAQGAGGAIPPNAWLTFDVELVDVR